MTDALRSGDDRLVDLECIHQTGFDWGARTANIIAALWPERCKALVAVSGYLIGSQAMGSIASLR